MAAAQFLILLIVSEAVIISNQQSITIHNKNITHSILFKAFKECEHLVYELVAWSWRIAQDRFCDEDDNNDVESFQNTIEASRRVQLYFNHDNHLPVQEYAVKPLWMSPSNLFQIRERLRGIWRRIFALRLPTACDTLCNGCNCNYQHPRCYTHLMRLEQDTFVLRRTLNRLLLRSYFSCVTEFADRLLYNTLRTRKCYYFILSLAPLWLFLEICRCYYHTKRLRKYLKRESSLFDDVSSLASERSRTFEKRRASLTQDHSTKHIDAAISGLKTTLSTLQDVGNVLHSQLKTSRTQVQKRMMEMKQSLKILQLHLAVAQQASGHDQPNSTS